VAPVTEPLPVDALSRRSAAARWVYFGLGWLFFGLGIVGVFLPLVPTTPFMLLTLGCFARSSRRFHDWLFHHRWFGPPLQRWAAYRVVPLWVKLVAWTSMIASTSYLFWRGDVAWPFLAAAVALVVLGIGYLASCPSRRPGDSE